MATDLYKVLTFFYLMISNGLICQNLDSLGLDNKPVLNSYESQFLNNKLEKQRKEFDFTSKKIGFATGHGPRHHGIRTKAEYFKEAIDYLNSGSHVVDILLILSEEEKIDSGGYDAVILSWAKVGIDKKGRIELIINLKNGI